jgi:hypothetical protein
VSTSYPLSRLMTAATSAYATYAIARPRHLADALGTTHREEAHALDRLAYTYGVRDLASSALVLSGRPALIRTAMALRVAGDLGDCAILTSTTQDPSVRRKVAGVTLGWASLNALAWWLDERRG